MPTWGSGYENPFYHASLGYVSGELQSRAINAGAKVRAGKTNKALEWSYGKTAYGHVTGGGVTLGFPGTKVMSNQSGDLTLYNSRNTPKFPLLMGIDVTNDGTIGSLLRGKFTFTYFPQLGSGGFSMAGIDKAFFTPGKDVVLSWGWSYGGAGSRQSFSGIVNNFNWSFNADLSMTADCSVVSAATIALGMSGDQSVKPAEDEPPPVTPDPTEVAIQASNLSSVIDGDLGLGDKEPDAEPPPNPPTPPPVTTDAGGAGIPVFEPKTAGEVFPLPASNTVNKYLDYIGIGWPFQDSEPDEEEVDAKDPPDPPPIDGEGAAVKPFWYITVGTLVDFTNMLVKKFEGTGNATALGRIIEVTSNGNFTQGYTDGSVKSAYPIDVIFPNAAMGKYGECQPAYGSAEGQFGTGNRVYISGILLGVDWIKKSYDEFVVENAANIPYKNITKFLETVLKRINIASGDVYQISAVLCEPPSNFDGNSGGGIAKTIVSIEDANVGEEITKAVDGKAIKFEATIFRPLIKSVSISSKPPAAMAAAAYTAVRGGKPANLETPTAYAAAKGEVTAEMQKAEANFTKSGFNLSWCEAYRGLLSKMKKLGGSNKHWINQALYPIDFTVTIDGISGFRFGDVIKTSLIPTAYFKEGLVFVVTKIDHKITAGGWETTLSTAARLTGNL